MRLVRNTGTPLDPGGINVVRVNTSAVERRTVKKNPLAWLSRAIRCRDLTALSGDDTGLRVERLGTNARRPIGPEMEAALGVEDFGIQIAAVCLCRLFVESACRALKGSEVRVAALSTGFPTATNAFAERLAEGRGSAGAGADEIDLVITRAQVFGGQWQQLCDEIPAYREVRGVPGRCDLRRSGKLSGGPVC